MKMLAAGALLINALVWGISWWPFQQLLALGMHPLWVTALVYGICVTLVWATYPSAWRGFKAHPQLWWLLLAAGLTGVSFSWAVTIGDVVRVVLLFYTMPAWAVLLGWLLLGEKPSPAALLRLALALTGVVVVLKTPDMPWPIPRDGVDALSLIGGLAFAMTNILLRRLAHTPSPARMLAMFGGDVVLASAAALAGLAAASIAPPPALNPHGWLMIAMLTLGFMVCNLALQYGAARLAAGTTALIMLSEIVFASGSSAALGAAEITTRTLIGGALILLAALLASLSDSPPHT